MVTWINGILLVSGVLLLALVALLGLQTTASLAPRRRSRAAPSSSGSLPEPSLVVLMPAHDEAAIIGPMVEQALHAMPAGARLLVVADNCDDDTASRALTAGAEVLERTNPDLRGKGYALAHGIDHLRTAPPDVVIVMDADCVADPGSLQHIASMAHRHQRPVQAMYDMLAPADAGLKQRMAAFAWDFRTRLRAEGYRRMGLPCQLMGSGMAFPWAVLRQVDLATGHIVEDLKLGLDCAAERKPPLFAPEARVHSYFPTNEQGTQSQRKRWEHGHLSMVASHAPKLLWRALRQRNVGLLALTLDMCVPPLALLVLLLTAQWIAVAALAWTGWAWPVSFAVSLAAIVLIVLIVSVGWWRIGRRWVSLSELLSVPWYIGAKIPLYLGVLVRKQTLWKRTQRD